MILVLLGFHVQPVRDRQHQRPGETNTRSEETVVSLSQGEFIED